MVSLRQRIAWALEEDLGPGDVTTLGTVPEGAWGVAHMVTRKPCVVSGMEAVRLVYELLDPTVECAVAKGDGIPVNAGSTLCTLRGPLRSVLMGERTALNLVQRMSGIATLTQRMVQQVEGTGCTILDTRKTTPLWRDLEKAAVRHGGGRNHRFGLFDGVLIKDNHIAAAGGLRQAVERVRTRAPHTLRIEVEVDSLEQLQEALDAGVEVVLLDNFSLPDIRQAVRLAQGKALLEVSGGVTLEKVRSIAECGVHFISVGALTHSAPAIDIGLDLSF
ncbi:carboxylating nicotinate-nucleotide diphosphorylase [Desulfosoma caldarium]|uniref:Probable nicotinate-nucleotide pyrophosphorylase [carboxylating] n=1 Tax=Desulfosoma caldarium TaxID=610254 RepID=A0A3N1VJN6_9BACT|nr:carboxylating nicotinate-nucleotide diphosphorylase [Desulfosoma caldarium]ROR03025.1 nicotinate-nucleotide pyrophosphorylase [carboxylating] [Desulfosoma caldarium]